MTVLIAFMQQTWNQYLHIFVPANFPILLQRRIFYKSMPMLSDISTILSLYSVIRQHRSCMFACQGRHGSIDALERSYNPWKIAGVSWNSRQLRHCLSFCSLFLSTYRENRASCYLETCRPISSSLRRVISKRSIARRNISNTQEYYAFYLTAL